jgi:F-type H+-transporting ATPase subunit gamma
MAENIKSLQLRMQTVNQVSKITNAMNLVAMSKLQKYQRKIKEFREITKEFENIPTEPFENSEELPVLAIVISSDLGLASLYNRTIKTALNTLNPEQIFWIGKQGYDRAVKDPSLNIVNDKISSDRIEMEDLYDEIYALMDDYQVQLAVPFMSGNTVEIEWRYINIQLRHTDLIVYEPNYGAANRRFQEFYLYMTIYEAFYQSKFSENMTRRIAMDEATNNANDMREELQNRYNQLRQEEITQEILELSAGAN